MSEFDPDAPAQENAVARGHSRMQVQPLVFAFVLLFAVFFTYQIIGGVMTYLLFGMSVTGENVNGVRAATVIAQFLFLLGPGLLAIHFLNADWKSVLRLNRFTGKQAAVALATVIALQVMLQGYLRLQEEVLRAILPESLLTLMDKLQELIEGIYISLLGMHTLPELATVLLIAAVTPAICEELLFRGVVQHALERGVRIRFAILLNGVIFGLFHLNPTSLVPLMAIGIFLSFIVWRSNSIYLGIIAHFANNGIAVISLYIVGTDNISEADIMAGMGTMEVVVASTAAAGVVAVLLVLFWRVTSRH